MSAAHSIYRGKTATGVAVIIALIIMSLICYWMMNPADPITSSNFKRIKIGMCGEQVERLLGVPPGDYSRRPLMNIMPGVQPLGTKQWSGDEGTMFIQFDANAVVIDKSFVDYRECLKLPPRLSDRIRDYCSAFIDWP
jgi:hypothetical protein